MRKIIIILIIFASNTNLFGQIAFDTITNWQLYKDSELLIRSNIVESQHYSVIVNNETNYESINFQIFYDYFSDTLNRKVIFKYKDSIIASYNDKNQTHRKFIIPKEKLTKDLSKYQYKKLKIISNLIVTINRDWAFGCFRTVSSMGGSKPPPNPSD